MAFLLFVFCHFPSYSFAVFSSTSSFYFTSFHRKRPPSSCPTTSTKQSLPLPTTMQADICIESDPVLYWWSILYGRWRHPVIPSPKFSGPAHSQSDMYVWVWALVCYVCIFWNSSWSSVDGLFSSPVPFGPSVDWLIGWFSFSLFSISFTKGNDRVHTDLQLCIHPYQWLHYLCIYTSKFYKLNGAIKLILISCSKHCFGHLFRFLGFQRLLLIATEYLVGYMAHILFIAPTNNEHTSCLHILSCT